MTAPTGTHGERDGHQSPTYTAAVEYVRRGWRVIALHWALSDGSCSCGRATCKAQGKHPRDNAWATPERSQAPERWASGHPGERENIGILTGKASGFWVLDFDPADADDEGLDLFSRLQTAGVYPHVRTGGGGFHWRFAMPADGREIRNRQTAGGGAGRTHSLPRGWDVRGDGGQVVAPPSVSAKGTYVELIEGDDVAAPPPYATPAWLLEMVAPPDHTVSPVHGPLLAPYPQPGGLGAGTESETVTGAEGSSHPAVRVQAYAAGALLAECEEYSRLTDGRRGEAAAAFARSLVEIANLAGWSTSEGGEIYEHFARAMTTAAGNAGGGGYAPHEVAGQWERAREYVGGRARVMPSALEVLPAPEMAAPLDLPAAMQDFHIVEPGARSGGHGSTNGSAPPAGVTGQATATTPAPRAPAAPPPGMSAAVWKEVLRLDDLEAAKRYRAARDLGARPSLESELLTGDTLDAVADPVPVVDGWLFADSLARLNGRPGQGKSFVAIDLACSVATGTPWHGQTVTQGLVLLMVAEGVSGVRRRVRAWEARTGRKVGEALIVLPRAVQTAGAEWARFVALAAARRPALVVLDTQARVTAGLNENLSADMGIFVQALEDMRAATGACVLAVHHKGKGESEGGRGSNAVEGAMVSEFDVWKRGHVVTVKNTKQKDIEGGYQFEFSLQTEGDSAVLVQKLEIVEPTGREEWRDQAIVLYEILRAHSGAAGITESEAKKQAAAKATFNEGKSPRTATNLAGYAWNNLIMRGLLIRHVESKRFGVHVMERVSGDGVLTPNVGEYQVADPAGWQTYAPDAVDPTADWSVNLGKSGGKRVSAAIAKM